MRHMDCEEVLGQVWRFLDGELDKAEFEEIQGHIVDCMECGSRIEFQRQLLAIIEIKCKGDRIPEHLRQRLFKLLEQES